MPPAEQPVTAATAPPMSGADVPASATSGAETTDDRDGLPFGPTATMANEYV
jgi:hypothetical protein